MSSWPSTCLCSRRSSVLRRRDRKTGGLPHKARKRTKRRAREICNPSSSLPACGEGRDAVRARTSAPTHSCFKARSLLVPYVRRFVFSVLDGGLHRPALYVAWSERGVQTRGGSPAKRLRGGRNFLCAWREFPCLCSDLTGLGLVCLFLCGAERGRGWVLYDPKGEALAAVMPNTRQAKHLVINTRQAKPLVILAQHEREKRPPEHVCVRAQTTAPTPQTTSSPLPHSPP